VEEIAFQARADRKIDRRSGVQPAPGDHLPGERALERGAPGRSSTASTLWWRAWPTSTPRCPPSTGKFEMEYEGELKGADHVARELIRASVANVFAEHFESSTRGACGVVRSGGHAAVRDNRVGEGADGAGSAACRGWWSWRNHLKIAAKAPEPALASADRFHPRRAVRAEENQPQRGPRVPRRRAGQTPAVARLGTPTWTKEFRCPAARRSITTRTAPSASSSCQTGSSKMEAGS